MSNMDSEGKTNGSGGCLTKDKKLSLLDPRFECPICLNCLKEPYLTKCGHRFCQECILEWIRQEKRCWCPVDLNKLEESDLFPDNYTRREITQQMMKCSFPGCDTITPLLDFEKHLVDNHENGNSSSSSSSLVDGIAKEADSWDAPPKNRCSTQLQLITTLYERVVQLEQKHRATELQLEQKTKQDQKSRMLTLQLEQKITNLESELSITKSTVGNMLLEKEQYLAQLPLRISNGCHVWNVMNIRLKLSAMSRDPSEMFYSEGFYTSYIGYKFCTRMNISATKHGFISLLVHLMKSENDHVLDWPFKGKISFTLVHPQSQEFSIREVMCTRSGLKAFEKPAASISPRAFGYTEFALVDDIVNRGFISPDGSINIKVEINCI